LHRGQVTIADVEASGLWPGKVVTQRPGEMTNIFIS
jgi:hypothetical protein